jgi:integrase
MPQLISFAFTNESVLKLASYLLKYTTGSTATLYQYVYGIHRFSKWLGKPPDAILRQMLLNTATRHTMIQNIDLFIGELQAQGLAPGTIANHVKGVKALFTANNITLMLPHRLPRRVKYPDRAPTPAELTKVISIAGIRDKVIISMMALGGFRVGTLSRLQYRHVKHDLETGTIPLHVHVEAEITKGKYGAYDTFLSKEAVQYLKEYLDYRKQPRTSHTHHNRNYPGERITDTSPIIRDRHCLAKIKPISPASISTAVHRLYLKAGLIDSGKTRYRLRAHSLRKYFRTQLTALGTIPTEYIEYMMGHIISTYNDVQMKGLDFLRTLYAQSGLSITPKTKTSKIEQLKLIIEAWGMDPHKILTQEALIQPHRTIIDADQHSINILNRSLKTAIIQELRSENEKAVYST